MARGEADINRCPPGGAEGIVRLAALTGRPCGRSTRPAAARARARLAVIDEAWCIGCTLCIKACPVDCIVGAPKHMHTVIDALCTGCELCLPACPVDCIAMQPGDAAERSGWQAWSADAGRRGPRALRLPPPRARASSRERRAPGRQGAGQAGRPGRPQPITDPQRCSQARRGRGRAGARQAHGRGARRRPRGRHEADSRTLLRHPGRGQPAAADRTGVQQRVRTAGRGAAVGAGHRRQRQQGHATPVRAGADAADDARRSASTA